VHLDGAFDVALLWATVRGDVAAAKAGGPDLLPASVEMAWDESERVHVREQVRACASEADYRALVSCRGKQSLHAMLRCFEVFLPTVRGRLELIEQLADAFVERQAASGVAYTELRYSPHLLADGGALSPRSTRGLAFVVDAGLVVDAVTRGLRAACLRHPGVVVNQILCCICFRPTWAEDVVNLAHARSDDAPCAIVAIDIAAGEDALDPSASAESYAAHRGAFARARALGLNITIHAGEEGPAHNVRAAIDDFGATRIGHGYALAREPAELARVAREGVHLEVCPSSSYGTAGWELDGTHPVRAFLAAGASVGISSDDPSVFDTSIEREFWLCEQRVGLSAAELVGCVQAAARAAFAPQAERDALCARIQEAAVALGLVLAAGASGNLSGRMGTGTPGCTGE
jgi:adenosine deaminase